MFTINKNANGWQCKPPNEKDPKSRGVDFNVTEKKGCKICCANSSVFGVHYFDLPPGKTHKNFVGKDGDSTRFSVVDQGVACPTRRAVPTDDPYVITIGSSMPDKKKSAG